MADVAFQQQHIIEDVHIPEGTFHGGEGGEFHGEGSRSPRCIGTPSEPGSPERPVGTVGPNGFGDMPEMEAMQGVAWVPAMGWDGMDFNMPICCGDYMGHGGDASMGVWAVQQIVDPTTGCTQWVVPIAGGPDCGGCCGEDGTGGYVPCDVSPDGGAVCGEECVDSVQIGEQYTCFGGQNEDEEMSLMQKRMCDLDRQRVQMQRSWEREREALLQEVERYRKVLLRYSIPLEEANDRAMLPCFQSKGQHVDCNMVYGYTEYARMEEEPLPTPCTGYTESTMTPGDESNSNPENEEHSTTKMANQLKALFPGSKVCNWSELEPHAEALAAESELHMRRRGGHAAERFSKLPFEGRRRGAMADVQVDELATKLETNTRSGIDDRALHALQSLPVSSAMEALQKVDHLIESQGGSCRNLSSILQSVCRKVERKGPREAQRERLNNANKLETQVEVPSTATILLTSLAEESAQKKEALTPTTDSEKAIAGFPNESEQSDVQPERSLPKMQFSGKGKRAATRRKERGEEAVDGSDGEARARRWADIE